MGVTAWLLGVVAASCAMGGCGGETVYKFTTEDDKVCSEDHKGTHPKPWRYEPRRSVLTRAPLIHLTLLTLSKLIGLSVDSVSVFSLAFLALPRTL